MITWLERGGAETWLLDMINTIERSEWIMDVACKGSHTGSLTEFAEAAGAAVHHVPFSISFPKRLCALIRAGGYDLVHAHLNAHNGLAVSAARAAGVPCIVTYHNERLYSRGRLLSLPILRHVCAAYAKHNTRFATKHATVVSSVSQAVHTSLEQSVGSIQTRAEILNLGAKSPATSTLMEAKMLRRQIAAGCSGPILLHVGSFCPQKNYEGIIEIYKRVSATLPNAHLCLVGDGPQKRDVYRKCRAEGLDTVHFLGRRDDVPAIMQASDALLLPSFHEGLPIVVMEAFAAGLPVVASNIPSIAEAIEHGRNGMLVDVHDLDRFASELLRLANDPHLAARIAAEGKTAYAQRFSLEAAAERLLDLYASVFKTE